MHSFRRHRKVMRLSLPHTLGFLAALAVVFGILAGSSAYAHDEETGLPGMETFSISDMGGWGQTFGTCEDSRGVIYVADLKGVLIYDGRRWRTVIHPERRTPFSLATGADDRIYIGYGGDLCVLDVKENETPVITSLKPLLPDSLQDIEEIWYTLSTPDGIYFASDTRLYRLTPDPTGSSLGTLKTWTFPADRWLRSVDLVNGHFYIIQRKVGLCELKGDTITPVEGGDRLIPFLPLNILPYGDGIVLVAGNDFDYKSDWMLFDGKHFTPFSGEITRFSESNEGYICIPLTDDRFALATMKNGVAIFDKQGRILQNLNRQTGLPDNAVENLFLSRTSDIWVMMNYGLARVDYDNTFETFDHRLGLDGNVMDIVRFDGKIYVATDQGIFRSHPSILPGSAMTFDRIKGADDWIWGFQQAGQQLVASGSAGLYQIKQGSLQATMVEDSLFLEGLALSPDGNHLLLGTSYDGLRDLKRNGNRWEYNGKIADWNEPIRSIYPAPDGSYWISYDDAELKQVRIDFSDTPAKMTEAKEFGTWSGLPIEDYYYPVDYHKHLYAAGLEGLFLYHPDTEQFTPVQLVDGQNRPIHPELSLPKIASDGTLWFSTDRSPLAIAHAVAPDTFQLRSIYMEGPLQTVDAIWFDPDSSLWAGGGSARVVHLHHPEQKPHVPLYPPLISEVRYRKHTIYNFLSTSFKVNPKLAYPKNDIEFIYSLPQATSRSQDDFQYRIVGLDSSWSDWTHEARLSYTHLPIGHYRFEVRGRVRHGEPSAQMAYAFQITPPWYRTTLAYLGYILLGLGFVYGYVRFRIRRLIRRNQQLETFLDQRAKEAVQQYELAQKAEMEAQKLRTANQLAATIAHEFNNPLAVLNGMCDLYDMDLYREKDIGKMTHRVRNQVTKMSGLVNKLMSIEELKEIHYAMGYKIFDLHSVRKNLDSSHDEDTSDSVNDPPSG